MTHECKLCKSDKMQDLLLDGNGKLFCRSCREIVYEEDIHPDILKKLRKN